MLKYNRRRLPELLSLALPLAAWVLYFVGIGDNGWLQTASGLLLVGCVLSAVHHAEVVAHRVGEPFGTIILALAITVIEVALIVSLMIAGGESAAKLARDTVFAAIMLILNGILGLCLMVGGLKHHEQFFGKKSASTALVTLVSILVLTLVLPNFTTSTVGPTYSAEQMVFVAVVSLVLYVSFMLMQTVRHRDYFLPEGAVVHHAHAAPPSWPAAFGSLCFLLICLGIVVLSAKSLSPAVEAIVADWGAPQALVGVIIAAVVLMPEGLAAVAAARRNLLQTSINLALGSALASIGLTIPAVVLVCLMYDVPVVLGLDFKSMILLALSSFVVMLSLNQGRTNMMYGIVLLVNLAAYVFTVIVP